MFFQVGFIYCMKSGFIISSLIFVCAAYLGWRSSDLFRENFPNADLSNWKQYSESSAELSGFLDSPVIEEFVMDEAPDCFRSCISLVDLLKNDLIQMKSPNASQVGRELRWELIAIGEGKRSFQLRNCTIHQVLQEFCRQWGFIIFIHGNYIRFEEPGAIFNNKNAILITP
jgi:hypothetical protein